MLSITAPTWLARTTARPASRNRRATMVAVIACALSLPVLAPPGLGLADQAKPRIELLVMEQIGCAYCEQWRDEVGTNFHKSDEAQRATLRYVDIHQPLPDDLKVKGTAFTPSFVLAVDGAEVSRMEGYLNESFFWGYLDAMLDKHLGPND